MNGSISRRVGISLALGMLLLGGTLSCGSDRASVSANRTVSIPPGLVGETLLQATRDVNALGLTVSEIRTKADPTASPGNVVDVLRLDASNAVGQHMQRGSSVILVYAPGPDNVTMPSLTGVTESAAESTLTSSFYNFNLVLVREPNAIRPGNVIRTDPAGGHPVAQGATVVLYVAR